MTPDTPELPAVARYIIEMTNRVRTEEKLRDVRENVALSNTARAYADYLARNNLFSHTADGRKVADRVEEKGYVWCTVSENLASVTDSLGFESRALAKRTVEGWLNSKGHRENMLAPHVTEIGVGLARVPGTVPKYVAVQLFARPKSLSYTFQITNSTREPVTYTFGGETQEIAPSMGIQHQACVPSAISFDQVGKGAGAREIKARYEATDGIVYVLKPDKAKGVTVEIEPRRRVE